jgi:transglutaminase-like putative cysteine protease
VLGDASGPIDEAIWGGSRTVFRVIDADRDRRVSREEIARSLGRHALRLACGHPAHGPMLPRGTRYAWRGLARQVVFPLREAKAAYMARPTEDDASDPIVRDWARQFRRVPEERRAEAILRLCQDCLRYERDPAWHDGGGNRHGIELLDSSAVCLHRGYGDCDAKARLFVALCLACGLHAAIEPVFRGKAGFPHVRARVLVESREAGAPPTWQVADPTIVNSGIGRLPRRPRMAWPRPLRSSI